MENVHLVGYARGRATWKKTVGLKGNHNAAICNGHFNKACNYRKIIKLIFFFFLEENDSESGVANRASLV